MSRKINFISELSESTNIYQTIDQASRLAAGYEEIPVRYLFNLVTNCLWKYFELWVLLPETISQLKPIT